MLVYIVKFFALLLVKCIVLIFNKVDILQKNCNRMLIVCFWGRNMRFNVWIVFYHNHCNIFCNILSYGSILFLFPYYECCFLYNISKATIPVQLVFIITYMFISLTFGQFQSMIWPIASQWYFSALRVSFCYEQIIEPSITALMLQLKWYGHNEITIKALWISIILFGTC